MDPSQWTVAIIIAVPLTFRIKYSEHKLHTPI